MSSSLPGSGRLPGRDSVHLTGGDGRAPDLQTAGITRKIPCYELLEEENLVRIEDQAEWILQEIGIEFQGDPTALRLFRAAGAEVSGNRVRFERGHARALCATAPRAFALHGRNPQRTVWFGGDRVVLGPAYGSPFVRDLGGGRRNGTLDDFINFVKLTYMTPWLHHGGGTLCEPMDVPVSERHLHMVYAHLRYSDKPFMGAVTSPERAHDSIEMARLVFGSDFLEKHCVIHGNINANSPLVYDGSMSGALRTYAAANQGVIISPFILGGAMGPVTPAATLAQAHAEAMVGIALAQLVRPGSPVIYGNLLTTMDLKSCTPTFGTPDAALSTLAVGQLARRLGLPFRCGGHYTASKIADAQALQESADSMTPALLAGANFIFHAAGWLEGGLTMGYEKFILDADRCGMISRMLAGLTVDDNTLGTAAFLEIGPGGEFLGAEHTFANFREANYVSEIADTSTYENWRASGEPDAARRAFVRWNDMLKAYEPPAIDPAIDEALTEFIARKKQDSQKINPTV